MTNRARPALRLAPLSCLGAAIGVVAASACYIDDPLRYLAEPGVADAGADALTEAGSCNEMVCEDDNPCTIDGCVEGACVHDPAPAGTACPSDDPCAGATTCDGTGACVISAPAPIDDGNPCTEDVCEPTTGVITHTPKAGCLAPTTTDGAPSARRLHTAVWTGSRMVVWGGLGAGSPAVTATGARYDPAQDAWTEITTIGAPPPRHSHCAVWTGSKMIVWGGFGAAGHEVTGGVYDPAGDSWSAMSTAGAPSGRIGFSCVWTGKDLVVWGGTNGPSALFNGARYDLASDTWSAVTLTGGLGPRYGHSAVWAGDRMIVWGGNDLFDWHHDGAHYDPASDAWTGPTPLASAPVSREQHTAIWTGSRMVVWGGFDGGEYRGDGGSLDPLGGSWVALAAAGAPAGRTDHATVWTGNRMIVWGGCGTDACKQIYGDGGVWAPDAAGGSWTAIAESAEVPGRRGATAVWTGSAAVLWGGRTSKGESAAGAILYP